MYSIYKIWNEVNDKLYIGCTIRPIEERFQEHKYRVYERVTHLYSAMRKYGRDKFHIELIDTASSKEEMFEKEMYYIKLFDTYKNGYNLTLGGDGFQPIELNEEKIIEMYKDGMSSEEIAEEFGISGNTILRRLRSNGIKPNWRKLPDYVYEGILKDYVNTENLSETARRFGVSRDIVRYTVLTGPYPLFPKTKGNTRIGGRDTYHKILNGEITKEQLMTKHKLTEDQLSQILQWYEQTENIQF